MIALTLAGPSAAQDWPGLDVHGLIDGRYVHTGDVESTENGGYGALRYGADARGQDRDLLRLSDASLIADLKLDWDLDFITHLRAIPEQRTAFDVIESYLRWRPVSISNWRFAFKAGYFFPEISLENTSIAWTSPYTLTASAIDSWFGQEIRVLSTEASLEWRSSDWRAKGAMGIFFGNDPAGVVLDRYGFILSDRLTGLMDRVRLPNDPANVEHYAYPIKVIDSQPGIYFTSAVSKGEEFKLIAALYDNNADPRDFSNGVFAWHTRFAELGAQALLPGEIDVLAQWLIGNTRVEPFGNLVEDVDFRSVYGLISRQFGAHRFSLRGDLFEVTDQFHQDSYQHGAAATFAWIYYPFDHARLTIEAIYSNSFQPIAADLGQSPRLREVQIQTSWRYYF